MLQGYFCMEHMECGSLLPLFMQRTSIVPDSDQSIALVSPGVFAGQNMLSTHGNWAGAKLTLRFVLRIDSR
jgi:hypothetical protein